jgi:hypothetical protein
MMECRSFTAGFKQYLVQSTAAGLAEVELFLIGELQAVVGVHNPTHKRASYKRPGKSGAKTHTTFDHGASAGGPPWTRTTQGLHAIASEIFDGGLRLRIGVRSNAAYMLMLDQGINYGSVGKGIHHAATTKRKKRGLAEAAYHPRSGATMAWPWAGVTVERYWPTIEQLLRTGFH